MLDGKSTLLAHRLQNVALILLSLFFLPFDTFVLLTSYVARIWYSGAISLHAQARRTPGFRARTVLVTGVGMTKGLCLARMFYEAGHDVIGADFELNGSLVCGRVSISLKQFFRLQKPSAELGSTKYVRDLLDIIVKQNVELWVSCSGVASAVEDGEAKEIIEARTNCRAIQFDVQNTQKLHEKHLFMKHTADIGLTIPETHTVTSHSRLENILQHCPPGRKYIMKPTGVDDSARGDMTLLPKSSQIETLKHIARLKISASSPWILQQFIKGPEFCTHALIVRGRVKAFVACPSSDLLMHYESLSSDSALSLAMLKFTETFAAKGGNDFTGHLSFDFLVEEKRIFSPESIVLYPIECNPRAHTAVALFNGTIQMVGAYLSLLEQDKSTNLVIEPQLHHRYYWIGHDLVEFCILPLISFLIFESSLSHLLNNMKTILSHILFWKDGTFEVWDPLPWWWLYHVYWPMQFLHCIRTGKKWSRINVSTTKMFTC